MDPSDATTITGWNLFWFVQLEVWQIYSDNAQQAGSEASLSCIMMAGLLSLIICALTEYVWGPLASPCLASGCFGGVRTPLLYPTYILHSHLRTQKNAHTHTCGRGFLFLWERDSPASSARFKHPKPGVAQVGDIQASADVHLDLIELSENPIFEGSPDTEAGLFTLHFALLLRCLLRKLALSLGKRLELAGCVVLPMRSTQTILGGRCHKTQVRSKNGLPFPVLLMA